MITRCNSILVRKLMFAAALMLALSAKAQQETQPPVASDTQLLQALISEVRQLRLAIEHTSSVGSRLQITLQRIQLQQNQVNRISGQLESMRGEITRSEAEQAQVSSNVADIESRLQQEQNPNSQKQLQGEQKFVKALLEQKARLIQDERAREAELTSSFQSEQARLNELQGRLDSVEKSLEPGQTQ